MQCFQCANKFSTRNASVTCPNCKFLFCKKCLVNKIYSEDANKPIKVCFECHDKIVNNKPDFDPRSLEPPKNYIKRIEKLNNPKPAPVPHPSAQSLSVSQDAQIRNRLDALRLDQNTKLPTDEEIEARLDVLRKFNASLVTAPKSSSFVLPEPKSEEEQIKDIINEAVDEARLPKLSGTTEDSSLDLDAEKEDYFCCICVKDATVLCAECDGDEFCDHCFKKMHKSRDFRDHKPVPIHKPRSQN